MARESESIAKLPETAFYVVDYVMILEDSPFDLIIGQHCEKLKYY